MKASSGRWDSSLVARQALARFPEVYRGPMRRINFGENTTFRVQADGAVYALRLYRPNRWGPDAINVEHEFMRFLGDALNVLPPIVGVDGESLQCLPSGTCAALFHWVPGRSVQHTLAGGHIGQIGEFLARLHERGRFFSDKDRRVKWNQEELLRRSLSVIESCWDTLFPDLYYDWRGRVEQLEEVWDAIAPEEGYLHGDMHASNLKFHQGHLYPIDFDDFGFGPLAYEFGVIGYNAIDEPLIFRPLLEGYNAASSGVVVTLDDMYLFTAVRAVFLMAWVLDRRDTFEPDELMESAEANLRRVEAAARYLQLD